MCINSLPFGVTTYHPFSRSFAKGLFFCLWLILKPRLFVSGFAVLGLLIGNLPPANAQTFGEAANQRLNEICKRPATDFVNPPEFVDPAAGITPLGKICTFGNAPSSSTQNTGSQTQATPVLISQQQLRQARTAEKHKTKSGASADATAEWGGGFSTFIVAGATSLRHDQNAFEQGYNSTIPSVTVGGDYRVSPKLVTGLAFNYFNQNGDFTGAGGFDVDSYSPLVYLNYTPFDRAFADVVVGYARQNTSYSRFDQIVKAGRDNIDSGVTDPLDPAFAAGPSLVSADFHRDLVSGYVQTGYDSQLGADDGFTVGPRIGLSVQHWMTEDYQESSNTGLELRYREPDQTSVQTNVGFAVAWAGATSIGTVSPYFVANWVHEFANDQRTVHATFVQEPVPQQEFAFETEEPARDWANLGLGVSVLISPQLIAFANVSTVQGNTNFESYGGTAGLRVHW